jgi:hypothetical protein
VQYASVRFHTDGPSGPGRAICPPVLGRRVATTGAAADLSRHRTWRLRNRPGRPPVERSRGDKPWDRDPQPLTPSLHIVVSAACSHNILFRLPFGKFCNGLPGSRESDTHGRAGPGSCPVPACVARVRDRGNLVSAPGRDSMMGPYPSLGLARDSAADTAPGRRTKLEYPHPKFGVSVRPMLEPTCETRCYPVDSACTF